MTDRGALATTDAGRTHAGKRRPETLITHLSAGWLEDEAATTGLSRNLVVACL